LLTIPFVKPLLDPIDLDRLSEKMRRRGLHAEHSLDVRSI
jgi:hypothetical protein